MGRYNKLLVAVDFSTVSADAFHAAMQLAEELGATLDVVHVVAPQLTGLPLEGGAVYSEDLHAKQLEEATQQLAEFVKREAAGKSGVASRILSGDPAVEINRVAGELGVDLIVMGTHGRTGLSHLLAGSVAESVLRRAPAPVLCVRAGTLKG